MSQLKIKIQLANDTACYAPGEAVSGRVDWSGLDQETESLEIRLIWFTRGKGTRDFEVVEANTIESPPLDGETMFQFVAPGYPNSISGKLISVVWAVEVIVFPDHEAEHHEVIISPARRELPIPLGQSTEDKK
ncbi:MAG: hypothetical protein ACR2NP_06600 [Pirellulaceae bacterium]